MDRGTMVLLLTIVALSLIGFALRKERIKELRGQYLKHSTIALIAIVIVFFQYPLDYVLGNFDASNMIIWVNQKVVVKGVVASTIGILCFLFGHLTYKKAAMLRAKHSQTRPLKVNMLVFLATISLIAYFFLVNPLYLAGYYKVGIGGRAYYAIALFQALVIAAIIQVCRNMILLGKSPSNFFVYLKALGWPLIALNGIYLLSVIVSGDRAPLIVYGVIFCSGYFFVTRRKLSLKALILLTVTAAFTITVLGLVRRQELNQSFMDRLVLSFTESKKNTSKDASISPPTYELARSVRTLYTVIDYIPEQQHFFYGRFLLLDVSRVIPFTGIFYPLFIDEDNNGIYNSPGKYITWIRQGSFATIGDGTSCLATFYLDFGLVGIIIGMFGFGYLMRYAEVAMYSSEGLPPLFIHVFAMVYLAAAIYIARGSVLGPLADCTNVFVFLVINKSIANSV
jgi:hypothetical protein